jgi:hypothetical protein
VGRRVIDVETLQDQTRLSIQNNILRCERVVSDLGAVRIELYNDAQDIRAGICKYGPTLWETLEDFVGMLEAVGWDFYQAYVKEAEADPYLRKGHIVVAFTPSRSWVGMYCADGSRENGIQSRGSGVTEALLNLSAELKMLGE